LLGQFTFVSIYYTEEELFNYMLHITYVYKIILFE